MLVYSAKIAILFSALTAGNLWNAVHNKSLPVSYYHRY